MGGYTSPADGSWSSALLSLQHKATCSFPFWIPSPDFLRPKRWRREKGKKKRESLKEDESPRLTGTTVGEMGQGSVPPILGSLKKIVDT